MSASRDFAITEADQEFFARELDGFVPKQIFDAHLHVYRHADFKGKVPGLAWQGPAEAGWDCFERHLRALLPGRKHGGLCFPYPAKGLDSAGANAYLTSEVAGRANVLGQMMIEPWMPAEYVAETVRSHGFVGLKCYHLFAARENTFEAGVEEYLPEEHVRVAHELGLTITLHMVRARAMADPANQEAIARLAQKYPKSKWILAHAARGFNPYHTIEGIESLRGIENIWCDTSAVTEAGAFEAIVRILGLSRLLYGSDFPVSHLRGRCVAIGDTFLWLSEDNTQFHALHGGVKPVVILLESLRALKLACWNLRLGDAEVERVFWGNGAELFGL